MAFRIVVLTLLLVSSLAVAMTLRSVVAGSVTGYDPTDAARGVFYSNAVKCHPAKILDWSCGPACTLPGPLRNVTLEWNDTLQVRSFVGYDATRNEIVMSFRGTITFLNWIEDAEFKLIKYPHCPSNEDCRVHEGFYNTYKRLAEVMWPAFQRLITAHPSASAFFTGHSLGGAQAQYALLDALRVYPHIANRTKAYNYGCPRTGNDAFIKWASQQGVADGLIHWRVVHSQDPVPWLPPTFIGYHHYPREYVWYDTTLSSPGFESCTQTPLKEAQMQTRNLQTWRLKSRGAGWNNFMVPDCGGDLWKFNATDHDYYLDYHMDCELGRGH